MALWVAHERVELVRGSLQRLTRHTPSGRDMECQFSSSCGSRLFHRMSSSPDIVSFLRIERAHGSIELGHLLFAPRLARTRTATVPSTR